jgi:hypothetical protein
VLGVSAEAAAATAAALVPMFVLQPGSMALLAAYAADAEAPGTLVAFVRHLAAQCAPLFAINLEFGVFRTHRWASWVAPRARWLTLRARWVWREELAGWRW